MRWARILRELGHRVQIEEEYGGKPCDLLVALHARRSAASVSRFRRGDPRAPLIVALTGTDLYRDLRRSSAARRSLDLATRIILLQPKGIEGIPTRLRDKARVIFQSAAAPPHPRPAAAERSRGFDVCVLGHLRPVKDPFRAATAARLLPASSRIRVLHAGGALSPAMARRARAEEVQNPRYRWLGELPPARARRILAGSKLLVVSSKMEGGANVVMEALACGVPVISSRIAGSIGILGRDYPGFFPVGDTRRLRSLLWRAETDPGFYDRLRRSCRRVARLADPARERRAWASLLLELSFPSGFNRRSFSPLRHHL
jgi:putative glycosyltransferase (TIGR04348 family)